MVRSSNMARCFDCGVSWQVGDGIPSRCPKCVCRKYGHLDCQGVCGRCGVMLPDPGVRAIGLKEELAQLRS